jgi:ribosomal protein S18 acetylase RimI-like enzyme
MRLRAARPDDLPGFLHVSLATGDAGADATGLYADPDLVGLIYAAPYLRLAPDLCLALEDPEACEGRIRGFAVGARDTLAFEAALERDWWPALRRRYPLAGLERADTPDARRIRQIHAPRATPPEIAAAFPAHLHLNLLPAARGRGWGRALFAAWRERAAAPAVHVAVNAANAGALAFWQRLGFRRLAPVPAEAHRRTVWLGLDPR